jgi:starch synthase
MQRVLLQGGRYARQESAAAGCCEQAFTTEGLDLILNAVDELAALGVNIAVLGKGEEHYHDAFIGKAGKHAGKVHVTIGFEEALAHKLYAASDFFLMPSWYEPCGIGQLIAMRYGTIPIARSTGGLADTVADYDHLKGTGTGFLFEISPLRPLSMP